MTSIIIEVIPIIRIYYIYNIIYIIFIIILVNINLLDLKLWRHFIVIITTTIIINLNFRTFTPLLYYIA